MIEQWMHDYVKAWSTDDAADVAALFAEEAIYRFLPYREPIEGREAIVAWWIRNGDSNAEWSFEYEITVDEPHIGVVQAITSYGAAEGGDAGKTYFNVWIVRFDDDGRCVEFTEYWMVPE